LRVKLLKGRNIDSLYATFIYLALKHQLAKISL